MIRVSPSSSSLRSPRSAPTGREVTLRIGSKEAPRTLRFTLRHEVPKNFDDHVRAVAPQELDEALRASILEGKAPAAPLDSVIRHLPPEDRVRAVLCAAMGDDAARRDAAIAFLKAFAVAWNREIGVPEAPKADLAPMDFDPAWRSFIESLSRSPLR
jgi:hypothetical protein